MGLLVSGAERIEHGVEHLKRNLQSLTNGTRARADPRVKSAWQEARSSMEGAKAEIKPLMQKVEYQSKTFLDRAEVRARYVMMDVINGTIQELEKIKRELERSASKPSGGAA